jgi:lipid A 3-O-deacylase
MSRMNALLGSAALLMAMNGHFSAPALAEDDGSSEDNGRFTVLEENDSILSDADRYYTQGLQFRYLSPGVADDSAWIAPFDWLGGDGLGVLPSGAGETSRRYEIILGQSLFTPKDIHRSQPDPDDRPYAGWLYGGLGLIQDTDRRQLDHLELLAGVVGPSAGGRQTQNDYHQFIGIAEADGWSHQLDDEPGVMLSYERKWRLLQPIAGGFAVDAIPELGATVGNVETYAESGVMLRFGKGLEADYGPARVRPALSGTSYFNSDYLGDPFGFYFFAGAQGRAVARNMFLDGNTFEDSPDVDKKVFVADLTAGFALFWSDDIRLDGSFIHRTKEFDGQVKPEEFAGINLSFGL